MTVTDVTLSSGKSIQVKRLGLFELDYNVPRSQVPGDYCVTILFASGQVYDQLFDISIERPKPDKPLDQCEEKTGEWYQWQEYLRWQAGIAHYHNQMEALSDYFGQIERYVLDNCISDNDRNLIETWQDFDKVYTAAIPDLPDAEYLKRLADTLWQAKQKEVSLFDLYQNLEGSDISYAWMPQATFDLMVKLGETSEQFLNRSKFEIGCLMLSQLIPGAADALIADKQRKAQEKEDKRFDRANKEL